MTIIILSVALFFNIYILHIKYKRERYQDMFIDLTVFILLGMVLSGTFIGFAVATVTSTLVSLYLLTQPLGHSNANT